MPFMAKSEPEWLKCSSISCVSADMQGERTVVITGMTETVSPAYCQQTKPVWQKSSLEGRSIFSKGAYFMLPRFCAADPRSTASTVTPLQSGKIFLETL